MSSRTPTTPGWYPDPSGSGDERRWNGEHWVGAPHRPARAGLFGEAYTRSSWTEANPAARRGRFISIIAVVLFVLAIVLVVVGLGAVAYPLVSVGLGLFAMTAVAELIALPFVIIGMTRAGRLGGLVTGVLNLVGGVLALLLSVGVLISIALAIAALSMG